MKLLTATLLLLSAFAAKAQHSEYIHRTCLTDLWIDRVEPVYTSDGGLLLQQLWKDSMTILSVIKLSMASCSPAELAYVLFEPVKINYANITYWLYEK